MILYKSMDVHDAKRRRRIVGYMCGILSGISYGTNPLFAKSLFDDGVPVLVMLFFRYGISAILLGLWMLMKGETFRVEGRELSILALLGILFSCSSLFLFTSYAYIPSGLATTFIYLYPVFVALIMVFLKSYPRWQTWISIVATCIGIILLSHQSNGREIKMFGVVLAIASSLCYALYLVIVNKSKQIQHTSEHALTFYALVTGSILFACIRGHEGGSFIEGLHFVRDWGCLLGLAVIPTMISMLTLAISSRYIGPTRTSVLGVFEPITAILIGTVLFSEPMTVSMAIGIIICIAAVIFMIAMPGKKR